MILTNILEYSKFEVDIKVNDHLIIAPDSYFSFADQGLL
jgi:DNA repair protein RadC